MNQIIALIGRLVTALFGAWLARADPVTQAAREAGAAEAERSITRGALEAQWRVTQAEVVAPRSDAEVDDLLNKGDA